MAAAHYSHTHPQAAQSVADATTGAIGAAAEVASEKWDGLKKIGHKIGTIGAIIILGASGETVTKGVKPIADLVKTRIEAEARKKKQEDEKKKKGQDDDKGGAGPEPKPDGE